MIGEDFLADVLAHVLAAFPGLDRATMRAVELDIRADHGGARHYVAKVAAIAREARFIQALEAGASPAQAARSVGVSTRHGRRLAARVRARVGGHRVP